MAELNSPVGQYHAEILMLAPESGECPNTLSLLAQFLQLGMAVELDENWRLPTAPPRDLCAYRACLFPDTAKEKYDDDLNAYQRGGGFLPYYKYYSTASSEAGSIDHMRNPFEYFGRDNYCFHMTGPFVEAGITMDNPDFRRVLQSRPLDSILADLREDFFTRYRERSRSEWTEWLDPDYLYLLVNMVAADSTADSKWLDLVLACLKRMQESRQSLLSLDHRHVNKLEDCFEGYMVLFGGLLMYSGDRYDDPGLTEAGADMVRFWFSHAYDERTGRINHETERPGHTGMYSEEIFSLEGLYWLARVADDEKVARAADAVLERHSGCMRDDGLWAHWAHDGGRTSLVWSRGALFLTLQGMVMSLYALDPDSARAARIRDLISRTYDGLAAYQDAESGLWRLVIDESHTRLETSGTCCAVFFYDRLQELGIADPHHADMIEHAVTGVKGLCYRHGVAGHCRGTEYGSDDYYRTRPLGFSPSSTFFGGAVGARAGCIEKGRE